MCVENSGAYDPHSPAADRRLTLYWIGWAFFGITLTSIFIAGVMVSMYKMNSQDTMMARDRYNATVPKEASNNNEVHAARNQHTPPLQNNRVPHHEPDNSGDKSEEIRSTTRKPTNSNGRGDRNPKPPNQLSVMTATANSTTAAGTVANSVSTSSVSPPSNSTSPAPPHHAPPDDDMTNNYD